MPSKFPLNPYLREYLYDVLYNMPPENKFVLKGKYYKISKTNFYAKRFCDTAKIEEIMHVLTLLGIDWFMVFFNNKNGDRFISNIFEKPEEKNGTIELKKIIKRNLFVTSGKSFAHQLATTSQRTHTNVFVQNLELLKAGYHLRGWPKRLETPRVKDAVYNSESLNYLSETMINSVFSFKRAEIAENDIMVLTFLFKFQHTYIGYDKLNDRFAGVMVQRIIATSIKRLQASGMVQKHPQQRTFTITALGIMEVTKVMNNLLKENSF